MIYVWAHRGASGYAPENTLEAFKLAIDMKADGIELDVQLSKIMKLLYVMMKQLIVLQIIKVILKIIHYNS